MSRKSVRRMQAVVPFGVGAIIDFPNEALMTAGLDAWPPEDHRGLELDRLDDHRLARRLGVDYFRQPPVVHSPAGHALPALPMVRFPHWHFCPRCRALKAQKWNSPRIEKCDSDTRPSFFKPETPTCGELAPGKRMSMNPLRFVAACPVGHIEDFPWVEWAHTPMGSPLVRGTACDNPRLHLIATGLGGLAGLTVECRGCSSKRTMLGASGPGGLEGLTCSGARPWLGPTAHVNCGEALLTLQRGASNIYFASVASSIMIPPFSQRCRQIIDTPKVWSTITSAVGPDNLPLRPHVAVVAQLKGVDVEDLYQAVLSKWSGASGPATPEEDTDEAFRWAEYKTLTGIARRDDLLVTRPMPLSAYDPCVADFFEHIVLVEKLAETRALTGFGRIEPPLSTGGQAGEQLRLGNQRWLPALRVHGEGIFLTLNPSLVRRWMAQDHTELRSLVGRLNKRLEGQGRPPRVVPPQFILLHTLAHLLIRQLSFECGYGTSSLRERIYCQQEGDNWMCGILLYTAAGDVDGTMGGLVSQGHPGRLEIIIENALEEARWCSSDPLCMESEGQGTDSLNLAACHACGLLPETSCEEGNRLLDRKALLSFWIAEEA